jgi:hypothetical protein
MHNRLIFRYHRVRAKPKIGDVGAVPSGTIPPSWWRVTEGGRRRVGEPRRWLSWGKRVGGFR